MENRKTELKNLLDMFNRRLNSIEEKISKLKEIRINDPEYRMKKEKGTKDERRVRK